MPFSAPPGLIWARRDATNSIIWACHCDCHIDQPRPKATVAKLCEDCANEAFRPWDSVLESLP